MKEISGCYAREAHLVDIERIHLYYLYSTYWIHGSATGRVEGTTPIGRKERIYITSLVKAYVSHT